MVDLQQKPQSYDEYLDWIDADGGKLDGSPDGIAGLQCVLRLIRLILPLHQQQIATQLCTAKAVEIIQAERPFCKQ
jgi:hypothetical protein